MKIFLISNMYPSGSHPDYGIFVQNIEKALIQNGAEISAKSVIQGKADSAFKKLKKYLQFYLGTIKQYRKRDFNLVYLHFISHSSPGLLLAKTFFGKKKKWIINVHGSDILVFHKGLLKWTNNRILKHTDLLVVPSLDFAEKIKNIFPDFPESKIFVSPSGGIDKEKFYTLPLGKTPVLQLGFVSRIEDNKGWRCFIEAMAQLKTKGISFKALIAGKGSREEEMMTLIKELDLEKEVDFKGVLSQEKLNHLYNQLDLFIFPTLSEESLGLVGLEAMTCGVPVIGSELAGLKTFIKEGENGYFFKPNDVNQLTDCILTYQKLPETKKSEMQKAALETAKAYEKNHVAEKLYRKFENLLKMT